MFRIVAIFLFLNSITFAQCINCGNGIIDAPETNITCPQDVPHNATCTSPCSQPTSFESTIGIRQAFDFTGTTTYSTAGLPVGWSFAGAPTATTAGALPTADTYGAKAGLIQPNCSGSCTATNGFCIGNLANSSAVGAGGANGKLGANFDGRANVAQNLSYAVLRGQGNPTLVSQTFDFSTVEGFKIQFWLFPSETSCGQTNSWGSCVGNTAYLDFSANGGTNWTQIMQMDLSSTNSDMCNNNSTNTLWLKESNWTRVCLTVFKTATSSGNFYTAARSTTAASGIIVNSIFFTNQFKFRIRYSQTASCTSASVSTTNPGRYLAIDYPVITSGNEMIPCGISFSNMCGYGADNNDDGVGSTLTTTAIAYGTTRRSTNQAERGVEILTSQNSSFASQNLTGSSLASNFDLCNAEGGDKQCIDWQTNNNFYTVVYECIADWEAVSGTGINVQYYKGTTPQSTGMTKVTAIGKIAQKGWRYSANRFVSCSTLSDMNPGCNGYSFLSGTLPTQFARGFYSLAVNSTGEAWSYYGATSCSHYFNGPFFSPIVLVDPVAGSPNYTTCSSGNLVFTASVMYCSAPTGFTGTGSLTITGPNGFSDVISSGGIGTVAIVDSGDYVITPSVPSNPVQCVDCSRKICTYINTSDLSSCNVLPIELVYFNVNCIGKDVLISFATASEINNDFFSIEESDNAVDWHVVKEIKAKGNTNTLSEYEYDHPFNSNKTAYYRLKQTDFDGSFSYSKISIINCEDMFSDIVILPNPATNTILINGITTSTEVAIYGLTGKLLVAKNLDAIHHQIDVSNLPNGTYLIQFTNARNSSNKKILVYR